VPVLGRETIRRRGGWSIREESNSDRAPCPSIAPHPTRNQTTTPRNSPRPSVILAKACPPENHRPAKPDIRIFPENLLAKSITCVSLPTAPPCLISPGEVLRNQLFSKK
jgi:hypothetical protein